MNVPSLYAGAQLPALIAQDGARAARRFIEFFTAEIRNPNTRAAYHRAVVSFLAWCEATVKQHLAALRRLFDWLVVGQVVPFNPAAPVRGPKEILRKGKTPVLTATEVSALFKSIPTDTVVGLRDRALISVMLHAFARVEAAVSMDVADFYPQGTTWRLRLHEKGGKYHVMPAHHLLAERLHAYISAAGIAGQKDNPLFRAASHKGSGVTGRRLNQRRARNMIERRVTAAGIATPGISNHTFRATGITLYMANGGALETAQEMAAHASSKTTAMYDHSGERRTQAEVERVTY